MKTNIHIIEYEFGYHRDLVRMVNEYNDYIVSIETTSTAKPFDDERAMTEYADKLIKDSGEMNGFIYLAMLGDEPVGFIQGVIINSAQDLFYTLTHRPGYHGWIGEFYVDDKYRGQGMGKELFQKAKEYFTAQRCTLLRLETSGDNRNAIKFYENSKLRIRNLEMDIDLQATTSK